MSVELSGTATVEGARRPRVVVVGAGIAGLAAAYQLLVLRPDVRLTVLEASPLVGGKLRLGEVAGQAVDLGAEAIINRRPDGVELARQVGLAERIVYPVTTSAGIWTRGSVRPLPRTLVGIPVDLDELAATGIVGRRAVMRARGERVLPRSRVAEDVSVGHLVSRRIGREIRDRLVEPMLGGVYGGRADELSLHATMPQLVPALTEHGRLVDAAGSVLARTPRPRVEQPSPPVFAGLRGGVGRLAAAVEDAVCAAGGEVRRLATVRELVRTPTGYALIVGPTIAPERIETDAIVLAVPATPASRLLRTVAPSAATDLATIPYASIAVVTLAFSAAERPELAGSGFLVPPIDGRVVKGATFSSRKWGWLSDDLEVVRCSIGRLGEESQLQRDDAGLVEAALADLSAAAGPRGPLVDATVTRWGGALPQYTVGHLDRVGRVRAAVARVPGLAVCGAAYDGIGIPACIASASMAVTQVVAHLRARDTMRA